MKINVTNLLMTKRRKRASTLQHTVNFSRPDTRANYSFDCDENGNVDLDLLTDNERDNYQRCLNGKEKVGPAQHVSSYQKHEEPAEGSCKCGLTVVLREKTDNPCNCGRWYNMFGHHVIPTCMRDDKGQPALLECY